MPFLKSLLCLVAAVPLIGVAHADAIPDSVVALANLYAGSHAGPAHPALQQEYASYYFQGFLHPGVRVQNLSDLQRSAYEQGQDQWLAHPAERELTWMGYGYARVDACGVWTMGWELNRFVPDEHPDESWDMQALRGSTGLAPPRSLPGRDGAHVRVVGHVSAPVAHKYAGGYDRFLIAALVVRADDPARARWPGADLTPAASATCP